MTKYKVSFEIKSGVVSSAVEDMVEWAFPHADNVEVREKNSNKVDTELE